MTPGWQLLSHQCPKQPVLVHKHSRPRRRSNAPQPTGAPTVIAINEALLLSAVESQASAAHGDLFLRLSIYLCGQERFSVPEAVPEITHTRQQLALWLGHDAAREINIKAVQRAQDTAYSALFLPRAKPLGLSPLSPSTVHKPGFWSVPTQDGKSGHWLVAFATYFCLQLVRPH